MTAAEVVSLIATAVLEIGKLIAAGTPHDEALRRIKKIGDDAKTIDHDVDIVVQGHT